MIILSVPLDEEDSNAIDFIKHYLNILNEIKEDYTIVKLEKPKDKIIAL